MKKIIALILALTLLVGCSPSTEIETTGGSQKTDIKVGIVGVDSATWQHVADVVADKGLNLELVYFDSYPLPNAALDAGDIDLNAFQHHIYLDNEVEQFGYEIEAVGDTVFAPLGIYSKTITSLNDLEDGQVIAIPDDVSNGGRAIKLLESAGLLTVDPEAGLLPTIQDIRDNPKNLELLELGAANIPATLDENQIAVINSGIAVDAGLIPTEDALYLESAVEGENPYINLIAARTADKDAAWLKTILEAYFTDETADITIEDTKGSSIPVWN